MNSSHAPLPDRPRVTGAVITDAAMPELGVLLGPHARRTLAPVLAGDGLTLQELAPQQVLYRPGRSATVRYGAVVSDAQGRQASTALVAACGRDDPGGTAAIEAEDARIAVWSPATDPRLPGLGRRSTAGSSPTCCATSGSSRTRCACGCGPTARRDGPWSR